MKLNRFITKNIDEKDESNLFVNFKFHFSDRINQESLDYFEKNEIQKIRSTSYEFIKNNRNKIKIDAGDNENLTVIYILQKDKPFILDTILMTFKDIATEIHLITHPILHTLRDKNGKLEKILPLKKNEKSTKSNYESFICLAINCNDCDLIKKILDKSFHEVSIVTDDFAKMKKFLKEKASYIKKNIYSEESYEINNYLRWIFDDNFFIIGTRSTKIIKNKEISSQDNLGIFKIKNYSEEIKTNLKKVSKLEKDEMFFDIIKLNHLSPVHKKNRIVSISIGFINNSNEIEYLQIVGLFTRQSFRLSLFKIPIIRKKAEEIFNHFGFQPTWNSGKFLKSLMESIPQDDFFNMDNESLTKLCDRVMYIDNDDRVACFFRYDKTTKFGTILTYIPKIFYSTQLQKNLQKHIELMSETNHTKFTSNVYLSDFPFSRISYAFPIDNYEKNKNKFDIDKLEEIMSMETMTWEDNLYIELQKFFDNSIAQNLFNTYRNSFSKHYKEKNTPKDAVEDISHIHELKDIDIKFDINQKTQKPVVKIYHPNTRLMLSELLPILGSWGVSIAFQESHEINILDKKVYIHSFNLNDDIDFNQIHIEIRKIFIGTWKGYYEIDLLNQLILHAQLNVREVSLVRTILHYLKQVYPIFSLGYLEQVCIEHSSFIKKYVKAFYEKFSPENKNINSDDLSNISKKLIHDLESIKLADHDKVLRMLICILDATVRTNYFQKEDDGNFKEYISVKISSKDLKFLPNPKPYMEIFVNSPWVEGIHLRSGPISRGGLRWSDRLQDYRTEVLGLMKAQNVKNAVIIPEGSKGGFVVKKKRGQSISKEDGINSYKTFIKGLLDITDNRDGEKIIKPENCNLYDGDDPYLVVAADKGTSTFSDIANEISKDYGFWLDDAFASGGSFGYDHKKMGITALGAWESVKHHFKNKGINVQKESITVAGVGDMSGDVFGNGMLCSKHIKLVAAFNHKHIFIDPYPDAKTSYIERKRLFKKPQLSWDDYDRSLISKGGGVFERSQKFIKVTKEMSEILSIDEEFIEPQSLIKTILCCNVDLLWFGGIGTYIKSSSESHSNVGDSANDSLRVNGRDLNAKVIAEGANLGLTQLGRVEYSFNGGVINTDAIDNVAGVNCSDHEVNLKILFKNINISLEERNTKLLQMTDEISNLVLKESVNQNISLTSIESSENLSNSLMDMMEYLKKTGNLDSDLEFLPSNDVYLSRKSTGKTLARPETCILLAYAKMYIKKKIISIIDVFNDEFDQILNNYFPETIGKDLKKEISNHPMKKNIISTEITNIIVNNLGPTFAFDLQVASGFSMEEVLHGILEIIIIMDLTNLFYELENQKKPFDTTMQERFIPFLKKTTLWYLRRKENTKNKVSLGEWKEQYNKIPLIYEKYVTEKFKEDTYISKFPESVDSFGFSTPMFFENNQAPFIFEMSLLSKELESDINCTVSSGIFFYDNLNIKKLYELAQNAPRQKNWENISSILYSDMILSEICKLTRHSLKNDNLQLWIKNNDFEFNQLKNVFEKIINYKDVDLGQLSHHFIMIQQACKKFIKNT